VCNEYILITIFIFFTTYYVDRKSIWLILPYTVKMHLVTFTFHCCVLSNPENLIEACYVVLKRKNTLVRILYLYECAASPQWQWDTAQLTARQ
jgi:hypothetical protein